MKSTVQQRLVASLTAGIENSGFKAYYELLPKEGRNLYEVVVLSDYFRDMSQRDRQATVWGWLDGLPLYCKERVSNVLPITKEEAKRVHITWPPSPEIVYGP